MGPCRCVTFRWLTLLILLTPLLSSTGNDVTNDVNSNDDVTCASLKVENGAVYRTTDSKLQNVMLVDCHNGFKIQGSSEVTCEDNHISGTLLPKCVRTVTCPVDCTIENGRCSTAGANNNNHVAAGEKVYVSCDVSYSVGALYDHVTCTDKGTFDKDIPLCVESELSCQITDSEIVGYFLEPSTIRTVPHGSSIEISCKHGYFMKTNNGSMVARCIRGMFDKDYHGLCAFIGVNVTIDYTTTADIDEVGSDDDLTFEKGVDVTLTCIAYSRSKDGLPFPEVTWVYPSRLRDYVEVKEGDSFVHSGYIASVNREYRILYDNVSSAGRYLHQSQGTLKISPTMEAHSGEYTCIVKLVNQESFKKQTLKIKSDFALALYFLLIIPVVLFIIVHCFYRKASNMNPFPVPNKLTRNMIMQEVDKKKKLDELRANPENQKKNSGATSGGYGDRNTRGRRGAIVDI